MLKINKEKYNDKSKQAIEEWIKECSEKAEHVDKDVRENVELMINALDKFIELVDTLETRQDTAYAMSAEALMMTLLHEKVDEYAETIPHMMAEILKELIDKM